MQVVLIAPPIMDRVGDALKPIAMDAAQECPPYGIYLLASVLREAGHQVILADLIAQGSHSLQPFLAALHDCSLIGIGATSLSWPTAADLIATIRELLEDVPIVLGGIHPTMFDQYLLTAFPVQYVIRGEGEIGLLALCHALEHSGDLRTVPNLSWRTKDGHVVRNPIGPKIPKEALGTFPLPDFAHLPESVYLGLSIESSRGCAYDCSFCSTSYRKSWRALPAELFVNRLEQMMQHLHLTRLQNVHIVDDEFSTDPRRAIDIVELVRKRGLKPRLVFDSRAPDLLYDGFVENIAEFADQFLVGAECGYDEGLARAGKGTTCQMLEGAALKLYQHNLSHRADFSFILGLPWETKAEIERTIRFAVHLFSTYGVRILLQWYCQIPGSRLWEDARQQELVTEAMYDDYGFFRNLYLFRSGVGLTPTEVISTTELMLKILWVIRVCGDERRMIEYAHPEPIGIYFPPGAGEHGAGLASLRQVSTSRAANGLAP